MKNNNKIYKILSLFSLVSLFLVIFLIFPLFREIKKNSKDLISAKNDIVSLSAQIDETNNFRKEYENYKPNLEKIDQMFTDPDNPVIFVKFLEDTASYFQVTSQISLPPSSQRSQQSLKNNSQDFTTFQFSSKGTLNNILSFLKTIESGPYFIEIEDLNIKSSADKENQNSYKDYSKRLVEAVFTIKAFTKIN